MKARKIALCILLVLFAAALIARPQRYSTECLNGFLLWAECILPSLFPFMVITMLLISTGIADGAAKPFAPLAKKLRLPKEAAVIFILSAMSGYPAGSRVVAEYYRLGAISEQDCKKLCCLCSLGSPMFIIGSVGNKMFGSCGGVLYLCCALSTVIPAIVYCLKQPRVYAEKLPLKRNSSGNALYSSFHSSIISVIVAGGFIGFFYTLSLAASDAHVLTPLIFLTRPIFGGCSEGFARGLIESSGGCLALSREGGFFALPLAGFLICFGGASIILQQMSYLYDCGIKARFFVVFKLIQGALCFALLCIFSILPTA